LSTAVSRFKAAGVTTVIVALDATTMLALTPIAEAQDFNPEWFVTGRANVDNDAQAETFDQKEWAHAFGISGAEIAEPQARDTASGEVGWAAYKEIDPDNDPQSLIIVNMFPQLEQIANGIQMAGPRLTARSFEQGLFRLGHRQSQPRWTIAGGFGP